MNTLKIIEKRIAKQPDSPETIIFMSLIDALGNEKPFALSELYLLNYDDFELALDILKNWRLDRYTKTKERIKNLVQSQHPSST